MSHSQKHLPNESNSYCCSAENDPRDDDEPLESDNFNDSLLYEQKLLLLEECCETAYARGGISSTDIYRALHSPELFDESSYLLASNDVAGGGGELFNTNLDKCSKDSISKLKDDGGGNDGTNEKNIIKLSSWLNRFMRNLWKLCWMTLSTLFLASVAHILICRAQNVNPLNWFPSLQESRCLLPSHPLVMELVRPVANCSICLPLVLTEQEGDDYDEEEEEKVADLHRMKMKMRENAVIEIDGIPSKEFFTKIAYSSRPIIIRKGAAIKENVSGGGMDVEDFNFAKLKDIFESEEGGVDTVSEECQFLPFRSPFGSLREAFDLISSDNGRWDHPWYIGWYVFIYLDFWSFWTILLVPNESNLMWSSKFVRSNCHPGVASKLRKLFPRPSFLPEDSESSAIDWIFIGSPGLGAAMHVNHNDAYLA
jgi:hypothetical protein